MKDADQCKIYTRSTSVAVTHLYGMGSQHRSRSGGHCVRLLVLGDKNARVFILTMHPGSILPGGPVLPRLRLKSTKP